ncbi:SusC/RagA family TonB-linked outer membrane protein [Aquimarina mytili]|uniref:SusC/RagA family TonB-linked outer membrane protein n=1 Tax=Aquimarina mytili TaxID=874423 RepID=A0A936ZUW6_9FLAO|nr:SusC/RagA family TonB-linked outer membrane protein [Aquimarina mytili]MBL0685128.1 SusC/RagA family TonB-linked outer membrane protein [Aquimarina mytili]
MRTKFSGILTLILAFVVQLSFAQEKTISGNVSDNSGLPLPGVNIVVKGTATGTQTDFDGNYTINVNRGAVLTYSYVGFTTKEVVVADDDSINIQLEASASELEEVVVTAQGISRQKKSLGYAVSTLKNDAIESRPEADIGRVLTGKVSGVNVVQSGGVAGSGTNIRIRGNVSITGDNQPLFVVNGIPFNTSTNAESNVTTGNGSVSASSRFLDIDPNSITNVSVLKGLSATVLYGDAGRNGVILITTKTGSTALVNKGFEVTFNQSVFVNEIAGLPDYQNTYGQGANQSANVAFVGNWGDRFDRNITVPAHYDQARFANVFPEFQGQTVQYRPFEDNVKDFFRQGFGYTTSLNANKSSENVSYNINFGHTDEDGYVPGNNITRTNFGLGGSAKLSNKFTVAGAFNFATSEFTTPPVSANNGTGNFSLFTRTLFIPRNLDLNGLPFQDPVTGANVYYRTDQNNPRWLAENAKETINVNRFYNNLSTTYDFNDNYSLTYRVGLDTYVEEQEFYVNKGGVGRLEAQNGFLKTTSATNTIWDHSLLFNIKSVSLTEKLGLNGTLGFNSNAETFEKFGVFSTGQLVFDFIDHTNYQTQSNIDPFGSRLSQIVKENTIGLYGQLEFDYDSSLYLTLAARNDWSSTIEQDNRSLFYPSASVAFVPTTAIPGFKSDILNFMKVRFGYGTSAGFPGAYNTRAAINIATSQFTTGSGSIINTNSNLNTAPNPDLKAELHRELEAGVETNLFNNRVNLELSVYQRDSKDQILQKTLGPSTGNTFQFINAGKIETEGIEVDLSVTPFKSSDDGFQWVSNFNFTAAESTVVDLPGGDDVFIAGFSNLGNYAIEGEPLGVLRGSFAVRDNEGNLIIDPNDGTIIASTDLGLDDEIIGDPNPDWRATSINTFSYKGFSLMAQVEYTHGGDFSSNTINNLLRRGVTTDTEDREGTFVIPGVLADPGTGTPLLDAQGNKIPNNIQLGANEVYFLNLIDPAEQGIYDGSVWRLREVSLTYSLPKKFLDNTPFGSLSFSVLGQNLWYWAPNVPDGTNFDPEVISTGVGNGLGLDFQTAPSSKKYGFSLKASF